MGGAGWTRDERKHQIVRVLMYDALGESGYFSATWYTTRQIAKEIGLKPTGYLRNMLKELHYDQCLDFALSEAKNGATRHVWKLLEIARWIEPYKSVFDAQEPVEPVEPVNWWGEDDGA